ncbi:hypothetical protein MMPV_005716 [Pyropia vietnamensis]
MALAGVAAATAAVAAAVAASAVAVATVASAAAPAEGVSAAAFAPAVGTAANLAATVVVGADPQLVGVAVPPSPQRADGSGSRRRGRRPATHWRRTVWTTSRPLVGVNEEEADALAATGTGTLGMDPQPAAAAVGVADVSGALLGLPVTAVRWGVGGVGVDAGSVDAGADGVDAGTGGAGRSGAGGDSRWLPRRVGVRPSVAPAAGDGGDLGDDGHPAAVGKGDHDTGGGGAAGWPYPRNLHRVYDGRWESAGPPGLLPFAAIPAESDPMGRMWRKRESAAAAAATASAATAATAMAPASPVSVGESGLVWGRRRLLRALTSSVPQLTALDPPLLASVRPPSAGSHNHDGHARRDSDGHHSMMMTNDPSTAFHKQVGFALLTVKNSQPSAHVRDVLGEGVDVVSGELLIRDGVYRTKRDVSLQMFGIYGWVEGKILLVSDVHSEGVSAVLHRLYDVVRSLGAAAAGAVAPLGGEDASSGTAASVVALNVSREDFVAALKPALSHYRRLDRTSRLGGTDADVEGDEDDQERPYVVVTDPRGEPRALGGRSGGVGVSSRSIRLAGGVAAVCPSALTLSIQPDRYTDSPPSSGGYDTVLTGVSAGGDPRGHGGNGGGGNVAVRPQEELVNMVGFLESTACSTKLEVVLSTLDTETLFSKAINYTLLVTAVSFLQVLCLLPQMESTATQAAAARVSLLVVGMQSVADSYLCLGHLTMGIAVHTLFNAFATAAFFKFIIFSVFQMRYLLLIWRAKRPAGFTHGWESMRRELSMLYTRFYGSLLLGILLLYELQNHVQLFLFALYSFWTPQIILSATHDYRRPLHPLYILGMSTTRLAIPLYFYACPVNFLHIQPRPAVAAALVAWMAVQAMVLASQHVWGPRWFVPKRFLPEKYDYYRPVTLPLPGGCAPVGGAGGASGGGGGDSGGGGASPTVSSATSDDASRSTPTDGGDDVEAGAPLLSVAVAPPPGVPSVIAGAAAVPAAGAAATALPPPGPPLPSSGEIDCVICMVGVAVNGPDRVVTPCDHFFHEGCLLTWMEVRGECPICRRSLPPP